jgi:predicted transcriptional regulator of viral defense system
MKQLDAIKKLAEYDKQGRYVYALSDLRKVFHNDSESTLRAGIKRLIKDEILVRASNGVFVYTQAHSKGSNTLEQIARTIRRGEYNYVSLESALSEYGAISQIPVDRLTVMTTGRSGEFKTSFGVIEFTHTKRTIVDILDNTVEVDRPLRLATLPAALRDLKQVGRNLHLVDDEVVNEYR